MIPYESTLERDLLRKLAISRRVMQVEAQPLTMEWYDSSGRARHYTPDFLVHWRWMGEYWQNRDLPWLIEVKPLAVLLAHWTQWHPKFRAACRFAKERGWRFRILDEARIRDVVFQNAVLLERYARYAIAADPDAVVDWIGRSEIATVGALFGTVVQQRPIDLPTIWHLIGTGALDCDLTQRLDMNTELWVPANEHA